MHILFHKLILFLFLPVFLLLELAVKGSDVYFEEDGKTKPKNSKLAHLKLWETYF